MAFLSGRIGLCFVTNSSRKTPPLSTLTQTQLSTVTLRGERDIAVGNVVGSNIFNILAVLGISSAVAPGGVKVTAAALTMDIPVMIAVAAACLPVFFIGHIISRWNGVLFLAYYFAYTATFVIAEMVPGYHRTYALLMLGLVIPLTVITLLTGVVRSIRRNKPSAPSTEESSRSL